MKICSYNIEYGGALTNTTPEAFAAALKPLDLDIIFFQESWYRTDLEDEKTNIGGQIAELLQMDYHQAIEPYGVSIATRLPIIRKFDATKLCGIVVNYHGQPIQLFNIHMVDWPSYHYILRNYEYYDTPQVEPHLAAELSLKERKTDLDAIFSVWDPTIPTILGGDFNEPSHLDWIAGNPNFLHVVEWGASKMVMDHGFTDVARTLFPHPVEHPLWSHNVVRTCGPWPASRIDQIFCKGLRPTSFKMYNWNFSDHLPLVCELKL